MMIRSSKFTVLALAAILGGAAALAANIADAATLHHAGYSGAPKHKHHMVAHYAPSAPGRYIYSVYAPSPVVPTTGHGILDPEVERIGGP
jgi:hypothetical protein